MAKTEWSNSRAVARPKTTGSNGNDPDKAAEGISALYRQTTPTTSPDMAGAGHPYADRLNTIRDPHHFTYKIPGLLAWLVLGVSIIGAFVFPRVLIIASQAAAVYMLLRLLTIVVFFPIGMRRIRQWEARALAARGEPSPAQDLHHVVVLPNYREPVEVLSRTLRSLAGQPGARHRLTVILAMEGAEPNARAKARQLQARFQGYFARILITVHPKGLPNESPGKSANQSWACRQARHELVEVLGIPIENLTLTSCDADSVLHPDYFAEIERRFAADPDRYRRFWHAPMRLGNNLWRVPSPVRLLTFFFNLIQVSEMADPLSAKLPVSTYTLTFKLADQVGFWDVFALADDWNMFLRCFFSSQGQVKLVPIFLPTLGDAVHGGSLREALANFYKQRLRHAWGCQDVGYVIQQWGRWPEMPATRKLVYLGKVVHDHVIFTTAGLLIAVGSVVLFLRNGPMGVIQPLPGLYSLIVLAVSILNTIGLACGTLYEHLSSRQASAGWSRSRLATDIILWPLTPLLTMFLVAIPTIQAQTSMIFGARLTFAVTPKHADKAGEI